ncbi:MAG TPA: hypothetical protein VLU54_05415 [Casimicrobiaceae bacterium]|nr:hypothetical protein [Casimicrobiaceae bacterium]
MTNGFEGDLRTLAFCRQCVVHHRAFLHMPQLQTKRMSADVFLQDSLFRAALDRLPADLLFLPGRADEDRDVAGREENLIERNNILAVGQRGVEHSRIDGPVAQPCNSVGKRPDPDSRWRIVTGRGERLANRRGGHWVAPDDQDTAGIVAHCGDLSPADPGVGSLPHIRRAAWMQD